MTPAQIKLHALVDSRRALERKIALQLRRAYPVGELVAWMRAGYHYGTVIDHGTFDSLLVRNVETGRTFWRRADEIVAGI